MRPSSGPRSPRSTRPPRPTTCVVVSAAEEGIFAAYHALLDPGDHVVVETPCYESALQVALSAGAEVTRVAPVRRRTGGRTISTRSSARCGPRRGSSTSTRRTTPPARRCRATCSTASSSSAPSAAPGSSATRCTASSSTTRPTGCRQRATSTSARCRSARCRRPTGCPGLRLGWLASRDRDAHCSESSI